MIKKQEKQGFLSNSFFATFVQQPSEKICTRPEKKIDTRKSRKKRTSRTAENQ